MGPVDDDRRAAADVGAGGAGHVTRWSQIRAGWPDVPFKLYGADVDSGTFDYFTEAIVGKARASRNDYVPSEDDNVLVQGIASDPNAIGYIPYAYFEPNKRKLKAVAIDCGQRRRASAAGERREGQVQPPVRPLFLYVNASAPSAPTSGSSSRSTFRTPASWPRTSSTSRFLTERTWPCATASPAETRHGVPRRHGHQPPGRRNRETRTDALARRPCHGTRWSDCIDDPPLEET